MTRTADEAPIRAIPADDGFDHGYEGHFRRQVQLGLRLAPAERLRRLELTMEELRRFAGLARRRR